MLEILHDDNGYIKAVCEYYIVDENGNFDQKGEFVWISELEVAKAYRNNGCIKYFIKTIIEKVPQARFGYFWRMKKYSEEKFPDRKHIRIYHKAQWLQLIGGN